MCWPPIEMACIPVMSEARLGAQTPAVVKECVKRVPSVARRSRFAVRATGSPKAATRGLISSATRSRILGRPGSLERGEAKTWAAARSPESTSGITPMNLCSLLFSTISNPWALAQ